MSNSSRIVPSDRIIVSLEMLFPTCKVALVSMFDMAYSHRSVDNHENGTLLHLVSFGILHKTDRGVAFKIRPTRTCQWQVREETAAKIIARASVCVMERENVCEHNCVCACLRRDCVCI